MNNTIVLPPFNSNIELIKDDARYADVDDTVASDVLLNTHLSTDSLDILAPILWLIAKKAGNHIDPLHMQLVKRRKVICVDSSRLHLVWIHDQIYIKPLPGFLLNYNFWCSELLGLPSQTAAKEWRSDNLPPICGQALGFLRSYSFLIRSGTDFRIAQQLHLIPPDVTWTGFNKVFASLRRFPDTAVSTRYHWGQFRLNRLNWVVRLSLFRTSGSRLGWNYHEYHWHSKEYLQQFGAPLLFVFAAVSTILSSMQVVIAAQGDQTPAAFNTASYIFSIACITGIVSLTGIVLIGMSGMLLWQLNFAVQKSRRW